MNFSLKRWNSVENGFSGFTLTFSDVVPRVNQLADGMRSVTSIRNEIPGRDSHFANFVNQQ